MPTTPDNPTPAPAGSSDTVFRERICAFISIVILLMVCAGLIDTYVVGRRQGTTDAAGLKASGDAYARQKDLLLYGLALLGTVTGYYFGRVPAELHAQNAQQNARVAQSQATQAASNEAATKATVREALFRVQDSLSRAPTDGTRDWSVGDAPGSPRAIVSELLQKL